MNKIGVLFCILMCASLTFVPILHAQSRTHESCQYIIPNHFMESHDSIAVRLSAQTIYEPIPTDQYALAGLIRDSLVMQEMRASAVKIALLLEPEGGWQGLLGDTLEHYAAESRISTNGESGLLSADNAQARRLLRAFPPDDGRSGIALIEAESEVALDSSELAKNSWIAAFEALRGAEPDAALALDKAVDAYNGLTARCDTPGKALAALMAAEALAALADDAPVTQGAAWREYAVRWAALAETTWPAAPLVRLRSLEIQASLLPGLERDRNADPADDVRARLRGAMVDDLGPYAYSPRFHAIRRAAE